MKKVPKCLESLRYVCAKTELEIQKLRAQITTSFSPQTDRLIDRCDDRVGEGIINILLKCKQLETDRAVFVLAQRMINALECYELANGNKKLKGTSVVEKLDSMMDDVFALLGKREEERLNESPPKF